MSTTYGLHVLIIHFEFIFEDEKPLCVNLCWLQVIATYVNWSKYFRMKQCQISKNLCSVKITTVRIHKNYTVR